MLDNNMMIKQMTVLGSRKAGIMIKVCKGQITSTRQNRRSL